MNRKNIPKLRFKSFDNEWEQEILSNKATVIMGQSPDSQNYTNNPNDYVLVQGNADLKDKKVFPRVWTTQVTKTAESGDIILSVRAPVGDVGITKFPVVIGRGVAAIKGNNYIYHLLDKLNISGFWNKYSTGSTFESISSNDIKNAIVNFPSLPEQSAIGTLFQTLDELLSAYKDNLANYQAFKATMLSKMFPKAGQTTPEIRLDGFDGEWEEKKLKNLSTHRGGTAIEKFFDEKGIYKVISIGSYGVDNKYFDQNIRAISNEVTDSRIVHKGELTMVLNDKTSNGTIIGRCLHIEHEGVFVVNQRTEIISPSSEFDSFFAYVSLNGPFREKVKKIVQGGTQIYVNYSSVEELTLFVPTLTEQRAIGAFFANLDDLIASQQTKIAELETLKKKLLQEMFV
ncbi:restriction endonuclease subunit S [Streptococcus sp. H31]|uniref:restriction endonuclease subunit S n=1 Tax=Streptococcus huangxiaojuni TaxID=3237239 RepID=UPI0034A3F39F